MGEKRKDTKGRVLKTGESQRKDGIYQYRYTDCRGQRQCVYAPTLQELRQKEKAIQKQIDDGIDYEAGQITVIELLEKYISLKKGVRYNTQVGYNFVLNLVKKILMIGLAVLAVINGDKKSDPLDKLVQKFI